MENRICEVCGITDEDYGFEFTLNNQGEWVCEEHTEIEMGESYETYPKNGKFGGEEMSEEFNLSEKRMEHQEECKFISHDDIIYFEEDVKEFIKRLKQGCVYCGGSGYVQDICPEGRIGCGVYHVRGCHMCKEIDKLAGDKLI